MARRITSDAVPLVEHRGKTIKYVDPQWHCDELGVSNVSLDAIKKAIDRDSKAERSIGVDAILIDEHYWNDAATASRVTVNVISTDGRDAFVSWIENGKKEKQKCSISQLVPIEHEAAAIAWRDEQNAAKKALHAAEKTKQKLPRHDDESLRELADKIKAPAA